MDVRQLAFLARQPSAALTRREHFLGLPKRGLAFILANAMFWQPLLVQAEGLVVSAPGTTLGQAGNGVPIVNIATPNGSGLSHNQFQDYNVGSQGLILNNAPNRTQPTELGGIILGNPNLKGGAASVILNEVTGNSPSQLRGYTEVAGQSAHVIVANPYGITCNGCGFINTPRVTLTTGKPVIEKGRVERFQVDGGSVNFEGNGFRAGKVEQFDVITRSARINAEIHAKKLNVITGRNDVKADDLTAVARAADGSQAPELAIDSSALGGMYAGAIRLVGTEKGVGVRLAGNMATSAGDIQIDANGKLTMAQAVSSGAVKVNADSVQLDGPVYAGRDLTIKAQGDLDSQQSLAAHDSIRLESGGRLSNGGSIDAGVNLNGSRNATGDVTLTADQVVNRGSVIASRKIGVGATQTLDNQGASLVASEVDVSAARIDNRKGSITASGGTATVHAQEQLDNREGKVLAGNSLLLTGGEVLNQGGALIADNLTAHLTSLDNSLQGRVSAENGKLEIIASDDLNNQGGRLQSTTGAIAIEAANIDNRSGVVVGKQVHLAAEQGQIDNRGGQVLGTQVKLQAAAIDNREQGKVLTGSGGLELVAAAVQNQQGALLAEDGALVLRMGDEGELHNQGGSIKGASVEVTAASLDNSALEGTLGLIASLKGNLQLIVKRIDNRAGLVESATGLVVEGERLDNSVGGQLRALGGDASRIVLNDELDNRRGNVAIGSHGFTLDVVSLLNSDGHIEHAGQGVFSIDLAALQGSRGQLLGLGTGDWRVGQVEGAGNWQLNGGLTYTSHQGLTLAVGERIASAGSLTFDMASLDNAGELVADGDLTLKLAGDLNNSGTLSSLKLIDIGAINLTQDNGRLASGGDIRLTLQGTLDNLGRLVADQALTIEAARINNRGSLGALKSAHLTAADGVYNDQDSVLFSGTGLSVRGDTLSNYYGDIYSGGDLSFAGLDGEKGSLFSNLSGSVESAGNIDIKAIELTNAKAEFKLGKGLVSGSLSWVCGQHCGGGDSFKRGTITITKVLDETPTKNSPSARLVAGEGLTVDAQHIENRYSLMAANGNMTLVADSLLNQGAVSRSGIQVIQRGTPGRIATGYWDQMELVDVPAFNAAVAGGHFDEAGFNELISRSADDRFSSMSDVTTWSPNGNTVYAATIQAGGQVNLTVAKNIQNGSLVDNTLAQLTGSLGDDQTTASRVGGIEIAINPSSPAPQPPKDVTRVEQVGADGSVEVSFVPADFSGSPFVAVDPTALPTFRLPQGDYGMFTQARNPQGRYLIETNPQLTNLKNFFSSDYLLDQLGGFDTQQAWRRLGDGGYETRLVSDAVLAQTGQRFLANGLTSEYEQFRYLMDNAIASKDQLGLTMGVKLSAAQVAALTHDIVWMEEREVEGEKVLAPVLYLAKVDSRDIRGGSLVQGRDVNVLSGNNLVSVGVLRASNDLSVVAGSSIYQGGLVEAGRNLSMLAQDSIRNAMAGDIRGQNVSLTALSGDIVNDRTAILVGEGSGYRTVLDDGAGISATGKLSLNAGRDLTNKSQIISVGDATLKAGRDINLLSVADSSEIHVSRNGGHKYSVTTQVNNLGSSVSSGGGLTIESGRDINVVASTARAGEDLTVSAGRDLYLGSATDEDSVEARTKQGKKRINEEDSHTRQAASEFSAGGKLTVDAKRDVTVVSSNLTAGDDLALKAGKNLQLLAQQNTDHTLYDMQEKGGFGALKLKRDEVTQVTHVGSQVKAGGDVSLTSGGDQRYQVAQLKSGGDLTLDSGGEVVFEGVKDLHDESHTKTNNNAFWSSASGKGHTNETLRQTQMQAAGSITIKAVEGLRIDLRQVDQQTVSQTIDAMVAADPQLAWIKAAEQRGDVDWRQVKEVHDSFKYSNSGLGAASAMIIAIVVAYFTAGAVSGLATSVGSSATSVAGAAGISTTTATTIGTAASAATTAVVSSAASSAAISTINNQGDLGAVFKDLTSSDALRGYLVSGITAGLTAGLFDDWMGTKTGPAGALENGGKVVTTESLSKLEGIGRFAGNQLLQNGTSTVLDRALGGDSSFSDALRSSLANTFAAAGFNWVGDQTSPDRWDLKEGSVAKIGLHAIMGGLAAEAAGGDFKTGALAAGVNEALVGSLSQWYGTMDPEKKKSLLTMNSQVIGVLAAAAQGGDEAALQTGAWVAGTATQYNYLLHEERVEMLKRQDECLDQQCKEDIREEYAELDEGRNKRLPETCRQSPELCDALLSKLIADRPLLQEEVKALKKDGKVEIAAVILFVVGQSNEAAMQEIVSALSQESEFKQGLGQVLLGVATGGGGRTPKPSVGQGGGKTGPAGGAGGEGGAVGAKGIDKIFEAGRTAKASELKQYAEAQGWKPSQTDGGPLKYVDENGIPRVTIKQGSSRAPGSSDPHVEFKDASGQRTDAFGNPVTRKSPDNHTPIDFDL